VIETVAVPQPYDKSELSYSEAARLARATIDADQSLTTCRGRTQQAIEHVVDNWHRSRAALRRLEKFLATYRLGDAGLARRRTIDDHDDDGAEDRRNRPAWLSAWVVWPVIAVSAIYDTVFFAETFKTAIDQDPGAPLWEQAIAYIPGVLIAMALIIAGSKLAEPLFRHRARASRRPVRGRLTWRIVLSRVFVNWRPAEEDRSPKDPLWPSWPLPVAFAIFVVGVLGLWAYYRAGAMSEALRWPMVTLLLLLTISAIAFKAFAHNPHADRERSTRGALTRSTEDLEELEIAARQALADLIAAWQELQTVIEDAAATSRRHIVEAWSEIADDRARHGLTGNVAPSFASEDSEVSNGAVFAGLLAPILRDRVLMDNGMSIERYLPGPLEDELEAIMTALTGQLAEAMIKDVQR
jgi:hypothetical protein